jgi:hypothetical protein
MCGRWHDDVIVGTAFPGHMEVLELAGVIVHVEATPAACKRSISTERLHFYFQEMRFREVKLFEGPEVANSRVRTG